MPMLLQKKRIEKYKPGVDRKIHLFAAGLLWTVVGSFLIFRGWGWIDPEENGWFVLIALVIGTLKSVIVLDRSAKRGVERISRMQDGTCLGAVYSWKTWMLVAVMALSGFLLRTFFDPGRIIGTLYCAIGWALLLSSRYCWWEWYRWMRSND